MATSLRKWTISTVYIWIYMYIFLECMVCNIRGFSSYTNSTQSTLCAAQCEALCLDRVPSCETNCAGPKHWMTDCDRPNCTGSCTVLYTNHYQNRGQLVHVPHVTLNRTGPRTIELSWNKPTHLSPDPTSNVSTIIYLVEETHPDPRFQGVHSVSMKHWTRDTTVKLNLKDMCSTDSYRVMAINQIGSMGFSPPVQIPEMPAPGLVRNIGYVGNGLYYYINKDNKAQSRFMAILQWEAPAGWQDSDISHYRWNPMVKRYCNDVSKDSLPLFTAMKNQSRHILMAIGSNSIDCVFTTQVQAVSKCNKNGPWTDFRVDLTNCSAITGYKCSLDASDPPGAVEDVTLNISSTPISVVMQMFSNPYTVNQNTKSPLLINLHVKWKPPSDLGSLGVIDHYTIRSGVVKINLFPVPPSFIGAPHVIRVSKDIHDLTFSIPTQNIPYTFGIQVLAVAPGQEVQENDWGIIRVRTIEVFRNESGIGHFMQKGKVLLDQAGIVIVYVNNSLPVQFLFDTPIGHSDNTSIDRYAVQWGPMDGPNSMTVENRTIVPLNQTSLTVHLLHERKTYGVKVMYLSVSDDEPEQKKWENTPLWTFTIPLLDDTVEAEKIVLPDQLTPLYVTIGVVMCILLTTVVLKLLHHRHHFKHLEERLALSDDDIGEDGDHYFIMRHSEHDSSYDTDIPTVVADHWELPHCCLKMGRILGSGAFGQVVKGRVSKSLLMHRGIDSQTTLGSKGTHVIVAVKMLQDRADERHIENFLKEIDMMKDIGYHRNIVSILGCCTLRQPYCLVVEHMPHGDLLAYFRNIRHKMEQKETEGDGYINQDIDMFSPRDLLSVARQITTGMDFLSQKGFVHRDLAARNILVGNDKTVKIGDFGLARYIYHDVNKIYVTRRGGKLPLRWMSPEAIFNMTFSTASDIWSFGIVLYEIVTLGGSPYPALSNTELLQALKHGHRMTKPDNCSQEIYDIMLACWKEQPETRPSFSQLCNTFTSMLEEDSYLEYFSFNVPLTHDYYRINSDTIDSDIFDLDDQGIPINIDNKPGSRHDMGQMSKVTTEIPDSDCTVMEMTKAERNEDIDDYTDNNFFARVGTSSSFNNGLYPALENDTDNNLNITFGSNPDFDRICNLRIEHEDVLPTKLDDAATEGTNILGTNFAKDIVEDRTSASSDEVFTNCPGCTRLACDCQYEECDQLSKVPFDSSFSHCPDCGRLDLHLTPFDIHVSERNDSAICSTASDDSDQSQSNQSDYSMAISDVYLMPDSPSADDASSESTNTDDDMTTFDFNVPEKIRKNDHSVIYRDFERKRWHFENPCYTGLYEKRSGNNLWNVGILLKQKYIDDFLVKQSKSNDDVWYIAETKL